MVKIKVTCSFCRKEYFREKGRFNEAQKFGWRQFCSRKCQNRAKVTLVQKICANPDCSRRVSRELSQFIQSKSGNIFCSSTCAAIVNNFTRRKIKICPICKKDFYGRRKYCSRLCRSRIINPKKKKEVLRDIKIFYKILERIPTKKEKPGLARRAQAVFGTWNKAIEAAGFKPNPVIFSKKFIAKDGHKCDSFAEKIIDDWLFSKKIDHKRNVHYPHTFYTADFQTKNNFVEFFGLSGEIAEYDKNIKIKEGLAKKLKINLIKIYPKDLFPISRLAEIIKS